MVRVGEHVLRPANPHSTSIHRVLVALRGAGFTGASAPVGIDPDGRERLVFIPGDVAIPPYPAWAQSDAVLTSVARLLRQMHTLVVEFDDNGVPVRLEYDLTNIVDEESSMTVTFTPLP